jgi:hypothetical protein
MSSSIGSGIFKKQAAEVPHLAKGAHGMTGEIANVRRDLARVFTPLLAVAVEEYDGPPPAQATAIMAVTASSTTAQMYSYGQLTGSIGSGVISPPRNLEYVIAGTTATDAPPSFTAVGADAQGNTLTETVSGTNAGAATYVGTKCFAKVFSISPAAGLATDATFSVGTGAIIGLAQTPKIRAGSALPLVRREIVDGAVVTTGALTLPATNPPFGAYTPATAPAASAAPVVTGTADITAGALYGSGGTLAGGGTGLTVILNVNGAGALTLTFDGTGAGNDATEAAMLAAIVAKWPAITAVQGGSGANKLVLTTLTQSVEATITVGSGTANTALGLTAATTTGTGHSYAIEYEFDASLQKDAP